MRLFVAINFKAGTLDRLVELQDSIKPNSSKGNFTIRENMHLTLAFLGECSQAQENLAKSAIASTSFAPIGIEIGSLGLFKRRGGDIWWAGIELSKELDSMRFELNSHLSRAGFEIEDRDFSPHITLAREVATKMKPFKIAKINEVVQGVDLMSSQRVGGKLVYRSIFHKKADI
ncbi:MAG: RNA 2',3'-cyclic phosphodiesterase [Eubacteriaceae bacterium]|nr:RNA 2',3'-cyclic phosphodiesterase [Eubacteriaceae bacterium]